jgi:hypothetical protein
MEKPKVKPKEMNKHCSCLDHFMNAINGGDDEDGEVAWVLLLSEKMEKPKVMNKHCSCL